MRALAVLVFPACLVLSGCLPSTVGPGGATAGGSSDPAADLIAAYRQAHDSRDVDAILALYCFDGADAEMRETVRGNVSDELLAPIKSIRIDPADPQAHGPRTEGGIRWRPSLEVIALMTVEYDTSSVPPGSFVFTEAQHTVGKKRGRYQLTVPVRE
jgi:hypothetical protein